MITYPNGQQEKDIIPNLYSKNLVSLPNDELLYCYLLANTPLKAYDDGLPDEEQKVLKYFGVKYWEPGMEEVMFDETSYKIVDSGQRIADCQTLQPSTNY
jgi:hypothetical protein